MRLREGCRYTLKLIAYRAKQNTADLVTLFVQCSIQNYSIILL